MNKWRLPTKEELNLMYELHKKGIGSFDSGSYWSSSEYSADYAWSHDFGSGYQDGDGKYLTLRVRAVRSFESDKKYKIGETTESGIVFDKNESEYKECKFEDEGLYNWYKSMKLFEKKGDL